MSGLVGGSEPKFEITYQHFTYCETPGEKESPLVTRVIHYVYSK
jgi:hypothetical protein